MLGEGIVSGNDCILGGGSPSRSADHTGDFGWEIEVNLSEVSHYEKCWPSRKVERLGPARGWG